MKLPLSVQKQQELVDELNPYVIPELVDALSRCQDLLAAIRNSARKCVASGSGDETECLEDYVKLINRLFGVQ